MSSTAATAPSTFPRAALRRVTLGLLIGSFMGSMESTVVATAMPTIVSQLGGLSIYGWAFSIYVLATSAFIPIAGKLSDIFGRRIVYAWSMAIFLVASLLCAVAPNMQLLIVFRGLQGIGAAGLLPLALIMIGDAFSLEQRPKIQGYFSVVWGVSSITGPLLGGFLVDRVGWPSIFYVNVPFGIWSAWLVWRNWHDQHSRAQTTQAHSKPYIDFAGAALVCAAAITLLLGLIDVSNWRYWLLIIASALLVQWLLRVERRSPDPILPLHLWPWPLFRLSVLHGAVIGWLVSGLTAYVPLYVQEVQRKSATEAGASLTPMLLGWVSSSVLSARLLLRVGYRPPAIGGMIASVLGVSLLFFLEPSSSPWLLIAAMSLTGCGFGFTVPAILIAVQSRVERQSMGAATASIQFMRNIGGSVGVGIMGGVFNLLLAQQGVAGATHSTFLICIAISLLGLLFTIRAPRD
jgi:EmrB/QacA subfamily drug resistance transporter